MTAITPTLVRGSARYLLAGLLAVTAACSTLPEDPPPRQASYSLPASSSGPLAEANRAIRAGRGGMDALLLLKEAREALGWRLALIDSASSSIDLQYFTWANDASGDLVLQHLLDAADRGVRVRVLVDDLYLVSQRSIKANDKRLAALNGHRNLEIRIFNPGHYRAGGAGIAGNLMSSFDSYNRRMHNKLLLADGHFAILGGRNITNEYYGLHQPYNFLDIDVMVTGPVSGRIAKAFDLFWNSQPAYAIAPDKGARAGARQQKLRAEVAQDVAAQADLIGPLPPHTSDWSALLEDLPHRMHSGRSIFLQDNPEVLNNHTYRLIDMVADIGQGSEEEAIIVTPYLIPVGDFVEDLKAAVDAGVRVRVLTASLAAGDHSAVHAHYKKYRKQLLEAGIELHEMNHQPSEAVRKLADNPPVRGDFIALHPKVAISDRDRCFIGSLNLDPRAIELNTENGLYISSEGLCGELAELVEVYLAPENAWRVSFDENGKVQWTSSEGTVRRAPARSFGQRSSDFFFRLLPLEKQL